MAAFTEYTVDAAIPVISQKRAIYETKTLRADRTAAKEPCCENNLPQVENPALQDPFLIKYVHQYLNLNK